MTPSGKSLIKDEIVMMMHNGPNQAALFYTFQTTNGLEVSLTGAHYIPVLMDELNKTEHIPASKVTLKHQLILLGKTIPIKSIRTTIRYGFYSPLSLSSYLFVNNITTLVFSASHHASPQTLHHIFAPIRVYYRITRTIYGSNYDPFPTAIKDGLHPVPRFLKKFHLLVRIIYFGPKYFDIIIVPILIFRVFKKK
ncbi:unnamed protein product [Adineta ricciae]|nr:unnamed protein product [Adineta ricciae]